MEYFFDSSAIIELINQNESYKKFFGKAIVTNALHLGEVHYYFLREYNKQTADFWMRNLSFKLIEISQEIAIEASLFKFEHKKIQFSYIDCIGYISALKNNLIFVTKDLDFKDFKNAEFVK